MSAPNALATPTQSRMINQGVKLVAKPLANLIGVPGIQDFVHNAQGLMVALKPRVLQAPSVNDTRAEAIISQIVNIARMVGDAMEQLNSINNTVTMAYLEKLLPFTEYLERMKAEIEHYQQRAYTTKFALQKDMAERLMQLENEIQNHMSLICLDTILLVGQTTAQTHQAIVQLRVQLVALQVKTDVTALGSVHGQQDIKDDVAMLKTAMAMQEMKMAELRTRLNSRSNCIDMLGIHRSNFF
ncbi:hypothetical protein BDV93DRAFT_604912 [Ceratobasidium sp. AG-I]|nr:hypothetical protein BDV93DRAFT_604912 [Ceratobasidium sp. AG-I]